MQDLLPDILRQTSRPSPHSYVILLSHIGYLWCVLVSWKMQFFYECLTFAIATLISFLYHLCDDKIICIGAYSPCKRFSASCFNLRVLRQTAFYPFELDSGMPLEGWHFLDVYYTFYTVMVITLYLCGIKASDAKLMLVNVYSTFMVALVHFARFTVWANIALWAVPFTLFMFCLWKKQVAHFEASTLVKVTLYLLISVASFVLANFTGFNRLPDAKRLAINPTAPETDVYWLFHSLWHFFSQVAIGYLLLHNKGQNAIHPNSNYKRD